MRRGCWEAVGRLVGRVSTGQGGLSFQTVELGACGPGFESWLWPFLHWASQCEPLFLCLSNGTMMGV